MRALLMDLRYAARILRQNPEFGLIAVLALALGTGATTAMFSVVDAVLLRPLPYSEPDRLAWVAVSFPRMRLEFMLGPDYLEWSQQNHVFENLTAFDSTSCDLTGGDEPVRLLCGTVTQTFFAVIGVQPVLGRSFIPSEDQPRGPRAVILTYGLWQGRFGGDRGVLGRAVTLDGETYTVIGVMPSGFLFPNQIKVDALVPQRLDVAEQLSRKSMRLLKSMGRLKRGVGPAQARAELNILLDNDRRRFPRLYGKDVQTRVLPLAEHAAGHVRLSLLVLLAAVACVLLIACVNVANLLLARSVSRRREIAIRMALGANRVRLARQLLSESALLGLLGGSAGLVLASVALKVVVRLAPDGIPRLDQAGLNGRVLAFTAAVSLATGLLFGLAPALTACRQGLNEALKGGGSSAGTVSGGRLRGGLVVAELALALMLLAGATLLIQSLWRLESVPLGFEPAQVLTTQVMLNRYRDQQHRMAFTEGLLERVASIPGVEAVAVTTALPPEGKSADLPFTRDGHPTPESSDRAGNVIARGISPEYFRAMAIPLRRGRFFDSRDKQDAIRVCIVNEVLVRRYFADENPIGKRIMGRAGQDWLTIIGVVADAKNSGLRSQAQPELYWPNRQLDLPPSLNLLVRTKSRPENLVPVLRGEIRDLSRDIPITFRTMEDELAALTLQPRFNAVLLGMFSGIALLLATVGIYGVLSYSVTQRTREIGIRMALGAAQRDVIRMVAGNALRLAGAGITIGLILVFALTRYLSSLLFEVRPTDPTTLAGVCVLLAIIALAASWIPARHAARVDPLTALRDE